MINFNKNKIKDIKYVQNLLEGSYLKKDDEMIHINKIISLFDNEDEDTPNMVIRWNGYKCINGDIQKNNYHNFLVDELLNRYTKIKREDLIYDFFISLKH